jgi:Tfp pilus assembly protein PilX
MIGRRLRSNEDGWVLTIAIILLAIMTIVGLSAYATVDGGQKRSRQQRERESSLNLAEGVLFAQGFKLSQKWPGTYDATAPTSCTQAGGTTCPDPKELAAAQTGSAAAGYASFANVDQLANVTWTTRVRDNGGPLAGAYSTANQDADQSGTNQRTKSSYTCAGPCRWDANGDGALWVAANTFVRGRPRTVVALLKLEQLREAIPKTGVTANGINVNNNADSKVEIWAQGGSIVTRCNWKSNNCSNFQTGQISPSPVQDAASPPLLTPAQLDRFRERAKADGRYYEGCPTPETDPDNPAYGKINLWGAVVFVENCDSASGGIIASQLYTAPCNPATPVIPNVNKTMDNDCVNQLGSPGFLIWQCGTADFSGGWTYVGILYAANDSNGACGSVATNGKGDGNCPTNGGIRHTNDVIVMSGGFGVWGAVAVDGNGCLRVGDNGLQVFYDPNVFNSATSYGTVGLVQNTWRELIPG